MKKQTVSIEELAKYSDQYILISEDNTKIVASAKTIEELTKKSKKIKGGVLEYIPLINTALSLTCK